MTGFNSLPIKLRLACSTTETAVGSKPQLRRPENYTIKRRNEQAQQTNLPSSEAPDN